MSRIETLAARAGSRPDPASGALSVPLQLATTFEHTPDGQLPQGYLYQRYDNPTQQDTEQVLAALDGAARALLFPTGMAAGATAIVSSRTAPHSGVSMLRNTDACDAWLTTSSRVTSPAGPLGVTLARSTPRSRASLRMGGFATTPTD